MNKNNSEMNQQDYECHISGPFRLERYGRYIRMSSSWEPGQFEKFIKEIREKRPKVKIEIAKKIENISSFISQYDSLEFLSYISLKYCFADPEQFKEIDNEIKENYVEYALSLALANHRKIHAKNITVNAIDEFNNLITDLYMNVISYFSSELAEDSLNASESLVRINSILRYLIIRGDSYPEHHIELIRDIFKEHDQFLKDKYSFDCDEIIAGMHNIIDQVHINLRQCQKIAPLYNEINNLYIEFSKKYPLVPSISPDDHKNIFFNLPNIQEKIKIIKEIRSNIFEIKPSESSPIELLKLFKCNFGDNTAFITLESFPSWPTNDSIIYNHPLIEEAGKYYLFAPQVIFRNIGNIMEEWIKSDSDYYQSEFQKKRAKCLERKSINYLKNLLPDAELYNNLFYYMNENGEVKRFETDGLILYDENLFILEAKSGAFSTSARRGSINSIKKNIVDLIDNAYKQALRTKKYILESPSPTFEFADKSKTIKIDKDRFRNIYLINTTLHNLGFLSSHLNSLRNLDFLQGKEWQWSVFINDFKIISELIEFPSEFLDFLQKRINANNNPHFHISDEIDYLMSYFRKELNFENIHFKKHKTMIKLIGYTEDLDRYYDYVAGRVSSGSKPKLNISDEYKELIKNIEATKKERFTKITTLLLDLDLKEHSKISDTLKIIIQNTLKDGLNHDFTLIFREAKLGFLFMASLDKESDFWTNIDRRCKLRKYHVKAKSWIFILANLSKDGTYTIDFKIYDDKWEYNTQMEILVKEFKRMKLAAWRLTNQKIRRKNLCPCNSGLKYKKCCGKQ